MTRDPRSPEDDALTHFDALGRAHMVDVAGKAVTHRVGVARGTIRMKPATLARVRDGTAAKGDVLGVARVAAIQGAKRTADLIPLCHPIALTKVEVRCVPADGAIEIYSRVECVGKTGVEMEALTAASVAALTIYDMVKAMDKGVVIEQVRLLTKSGGKSGDWKRQ